MPGVSHPSFSPSLQGCVERFGRSLTVPKKLLALHPRGRGAPGNAAALSPAILMGVLAAFEGFAEDFTATALYLNGDGFGQISRKVGAWNNPTLGDFSTRMATEFPVVKTGLGGGFSLDIYKIPPVGARSGWRNQVSVGWAKAVSDAEVWMQVRHSLTHGQATGWRSERWPGAVGKSAPSPTGVLRPMKGGLHSLALHDMLSGARIYTAGGAHVADLTAASFGVNLDWSDVFFFDV